MTPNTVVIHFWAMKVEFIHGPRNDIYKTQDSLDNAAIDTIYSLSNPTL